MSKILGVNKTEDRTIFILTKGPGFYHRMEKTLNNLGLENCNLPLGFPCNEGLNEKALNFEEKTDTYEQFLKLFEEVSTPQFIKEIKAKNNW